jgi:hypothetical protein
LAAPSPDWDGRGRADVDSVGVEEPAGGALEFGRGNIQVGPCLQAFPSALTAAV